MLRLPSYICTSILCLFLFRYFGFCGRPVNSAILLKVVFVYALLIQIVLLSATMTKIIKEMLPPDVRVARDAQDLLIECCVGKDSYSTF